MRGSVVACTGLVHIEFARHEQELVDSSIPWRVRVLYLSVDNRILHSIDQSKTHKIKYSLICILHPLY